MLKCGLSRIADSISCESDSLLVGIERVSKALLITYLELVHKIDANDTLRKYNSNFDGI